MGHTCHLVPKLQRRELRKSTLRQKKLIAPGVLEEEMEGKGRGERGKGNIWCDMTFL